MTHKFSTNQSTFSHYSYFLSMSITSSLNRDPEFTPAATTTSLEELLKAAYLSIHSPNAEAQEKFRVIIRVQSNS